MKQILAARLSQQPGMSHQLQQAIKLLQLSSIDLQKEIQEALDTNLMLEELTPDNTDANTQQTSLDTPPASVDGQPMTNLSLDAESAVSTSEQISVDKITAALPIASIRGDVWSEAPLPSVYTGPDETSDRLLENLNVASVSIKSHLEEQLNLLHLSETDQLIAMTILDGLDQNGILGISLDEVLISMPDPEAGAEAMGMDEVEAVLHLIQHLDPPGIAARDLPECLSIQLRQLEPATPWRAQALLVVNEYISSLANRDYALLMRKTRLKEGELKQLIDLIQGLHPRPGAHIGSGSIEYIEPDVIVTRQKNRWVVALGAKSAPGIRVNADYASMIKRADKSADNICLKNHLQEARWFIKSLQQRNHTLLKVATKIVEFQRDFFTYGDQAMKPLVLHDIAEAVGLHVSTISRVTTQKYMRTPAGVFELKYFFSSHVSTQTGFEVFSTAIRAQIKKLVTGESRRKPLSDSKIASLLADQDIRVARRTVAKYRESLLIPPSNERKQLA